MKLESHPTYAALLDWEQELCQRLVASDHTREALPFRIDAKIAGAVIVAAECAPVAGAIIVIAPDEHVSAWVEVWAKQGQRVALRGETRPYDERVVVTTVKAIRRHELSFATIVHSVIVIAGGVPEDDADWLADHLFYHRAWRLVAQPEPYSWPLGQAGHSLYLDADAPCPFQAGPRSRLSDLAEQTVLCSGLARN